MSGPVIDRVNLADKAGSILLYDWMAEDVKDGRNLMRVDIKGNVLWKASPPTTGMQDCFTHVQWDGRALTANTWSCYHAGVDLENDEVTVLAFTK
ncbi:hypothetical protein EK403_12830 [Hansschlegelia zhihuaiae]|uniref:Uncharacterized protein n=1 Tax=Hansschlegelia zhihuaiae TaxID=405005 RepID=A0A4Q0MHU8_9HYPH|nr:hypothetical protein EK403_12830 [Hansschlegelia zhihuaiae]